MMSAELQPSACGRLFPVYVTPHHPRLWAACAATLPGVCGYGHTQEWALVAVARSIRDKLESWVVAGEDFPFQPATKPPEGAVLRWVQVPPTAQHH